MKCILVYLDSLVLDLGDRRHQNNRAVILCAVCVGSAEAADQLGTNGKLVERLVEWCEAKDHAGVMGESNRLLSALIRHSKSKVHLKYSVLGLVIKYLKVLN